MDKLMDKITVGDCFEILKNIPDKSIDLIITDPPYNAGYDFDNDNMPDEEFMAFTDKWVRLTVSRAAFTRIRISSRDNPILRGPKAISSNTVGEKS